jgi:cytochrome c-type biogenesis protein CcmH
MIVRNWDAHSFRQAVGRLVYTAILGALLLFVLPAAPGAQAAEGAAEDPQLEARVQRVTSELRCLVCQNQTIADSHADLAKDLREQARAMLAAGKSEAEVRQFMVARYGDFVLYRPPFKASTLLLWIGPFVLLLAAVWALRRIAVQRRRVVADTSLTADEQARLRALVAAPEHEPR